MVNIQVTNNFLFNIGTGSCLTINGRVECDASLMEGSSMAFGAVGALSEYRNPIDVAAALLRSQLSARRDGGLLTLGRVPPAVLVGTGAAEWARTEAGIEPLVDSRELYTERSLAEYSEARRRLEAARAHLESSASNKRAFYMSHIFITRFDRIHYTVYPNLFEKFWDSTLKARILAQVFQIKQSKIILIFHCASVNYAASFFAVS